jgi:hypothetical protein
MIVLGEGRRGKGNFVLGFEGDKADITSPLPPVVAFGMIETPKGSVSITVRQYVGKQITRTCFGSVTTGIFGRRGDGLLPEQTNAASKR